MGNRRGCSFELDQINLFDSTGIGSLKFKEIRVSVQIFESVYMISCISSHSPIQEIIVSKNRHANTMYIILLSQFDYFSQLLAN